MLIELTLEQCDAIEEALAYAEVQHDRRIEVNKHILEHPSSDQDRIRCEETINTETLAAALKKSIRVTLAKARVEQGQNNA